MGTSIQRCSQLCDHPENQKFQYFVSKSQKQWVRKTQLKEAQKIVLIQKTQKQPEKSFFYKHDKADYVKGIVYSGGSFYQGPIDRTHCASGKGLQLFLTQVNTIDDCEGSYEGEFKENARHGKGIYQDKFIKFQGEWNNGFPKIGTLERLLFGEKNSVIYRFDQIQFNNLQRTTGICSVVLPDGSEYKGQFVNKNTNQYVIEGRGILKFPNNQVYDGEFRDGKFHGNGIYYSFNNQKYEGQYKNGLKNGSGKLYLNKNCYVSGQWINGKKSGKFYLFMITVNGDQSKVKQFQFEKVEDVKQKIPKKSK